MTPRVRLTGALALAALLLVALLCAVDTAASTEASSPSEPIMPALPANQAVITIGVAAALTPPIDFGWLQVNAVRLAISETNAVGGLDIGGTLYAVAIVTADSACSPTQAISAANALLDAGAVAVVGPTCSDAALAAQPIFSAAGVPMISASASGIIVSEQGYTTTFRVVPRDDAPPKEMARYFREQLGLEAVATVEWLGFGWSSRAFSETFAQLGGTIVSRQAVSSVGEYAVVVDTIRLDGADGVYYADFDAARAGQFSAAAAGVGLATVGWHVGDVPVMPVAYGTNAGPAAEGDYAARFGRTTDRMPGYEAFSAAYRAANFTYYGTEPSYVGASAYDAAQIILAALVDAATTDVAALREHIAATTNQAGVVGTYEGFDARGDVIPQWAWVAAYQNGDWGLALPNRVALPLVLR